MRLRTISATIAAGSATIAYAAYRREVRAAIRRIESGSQIIDSPDGPIEFAESGNGAAVFVIHGAGGGFDQGLDLGRNLVGTGYRIIAPSRFGYLRTTMPADASPQRQADAHVRLLDALQLERVPVIGVSAGGPSAIQMCLRHPDRCSALILVVPMAYSPDHEFGRSPSRLFGFLLNTMLSSDFLFWSAMKLAHATVVRTILGTPIDVYENATAEERLNLDRVLRNILPISRRAAGLANETAVASALGPSPLDEIRVPTLAISTLDDGYQTYDGALFTAEQTNGQFIGFRSGGHLLVGHDAEVRAHVREFLKVAAQSDIPQLIASAATRAASPAIGIAGR